MRAPSRLGIATWLLLAATDAAVAAASAATLPSVTNAIVPDYGVDALAPVPSGVGARSPLADSTEGRPIARIDVHAHNIFDPLPPGRLAPVLDLANTLHVRTREQTVRAQ